MKKGSWLIALVTFTICVLLLLYNRTSPQKADSQETNAAPNVTSPAVHVSEQSRTERTDVSATSEPSKGIPAPASSNSSSENYQRLLEEWQAPIDFYGKVVDENGEAIAGASIQFSWSETPSDDGQRATATESDSQGRFSLRDKRGASLEISVGKEGYYTSKRNNRSFSYALSGRFSPDPLNPIIYHLRKKHFGAQLIVSSYGDRPNFPVRVSKNGEPTRVDLLQRKIDPNGQLEIRQNKPPLKEVTEWSLIVSIPRGGLVENEDDFPFNAPDTNYHATVEYHFTRSDSNWATQLTKQYYIAVGQPPQYGWLRIESNLAQETVFLTYAINPDGSRNLEPPN